MLSVKFLRRLRLRIGELNRHFDRMPSRENVNFPGNLRGMMELPQLEGLRTASVVTSVSCWPSGGMISVELSDEVVTRYPQECDLVVTRCCICGMCLKVRLVEVKFFRAAYSRHLLGLFLPELLLPETQWCRHLSGTWQISLMRDPTPSSQPHLFLSKVI